MRLAIMTDAHANLPALEAALADIAGRGVDRILHLGDAIGIGPQPKETLERLLSDARVTCLMGNHEEWFGFGLPEPRPDWMSEAEVEHHEWVHGLLDPALREVVARWPWEVHVSEGGMTVYGAHYGLRSTPGRGQRPSFAPLLKDPTVAELDHMFRRERATVVCFGHDHTARDVLGRSRYFSPGPLGCAPSPIARWALIDFDGQRCRVSRRAAPYDDTEVLADFEARQVPGRAFIRRVFYGGR